MFDRTKDAEPASSSTRPWSRWRRAGGIALGALLLAASPGARAQPTVRSWSSTEDLKQTLASQPRLRFAAGAPGAEPVLRVDPDAVGQSILGLGSSFEHSTCYNLSRLPAARRDKVLASIVDPKKGVGMSLMRLCIGTPDFTASPWYTYDDMPPGAKDPELKHFSIGKDREYVLPVLKAALRINPALKFFASPWSPPAWMKTNDHIGGGAIDPQHFHAFAEYLARFVEAYQKEGLPIHAITIQNEPGYAPETYPTCVWTAEQQRVFIRDHLGPLFRARRIATLIWCFDHNFDNAAFPELILKDPEAAQYVDGTGFHGYGGSPEAMAKLRAQFPAREVYFTEGSVFGAKGGAQLVSYLRNGARSYSAWVTMIDNHRQPNPGPHPCSLTGVVLNRETLGVEYRYDHYLHGQFMKFIRPGALRLGSSEGNGLPANVAFLNPDGTTALVVANPDMQGKEFTVAWRDRAFRAAVPAKSVTTFTWGD